MCGIAGAVGLTRSPSPRTVSLLMDELEHRGPDSYGSLDRPGVWLGFRRLSILDLRAIADQPMVDETTGVAMVFNGEIYNYVELRDQLERLGHRFTTTGDTEVLLRGWIQWGEAVFARCNGMWAVGIDDPRRDGVLLCRDRFGEKPLFFGPDHDAGWWFASEPAALRSVGVGSGKIDLAATKTFLVLGDVENPSRSWFDGIEQLLPGTMMDLTAKGPRRRRRWWNTAEFLAERWGGPPASDDEVQERIETSVRLRLRSDVAVGSSLSGGVDSSTIVATLRDIEQTREVHTFTASFPNSSVDEWNRAEAIGRRTGVVMHRVEPTPDGFLADLGLLTRRQGGPIESPTVYAQWCVMRTAHEEGVTVLLDGQGADETWGGYPKYVGVAVLGALASGHVKSAADTLRTWRRLGTVPRFDVRQAGSLWLSPAHRRQVLNLIGRRSQPVLGAALHDVALNDPVASEAGLLVDGPLLRRAARADLERILLPRLLRYADRNSMAWSREVRLPFLDPAVLDVALRSDWSSGIRNGWTKRQLRRVGVGRIPDDILWRREKTAYEVPSDNWLDREDLSQAIDQATLHLAEAGILANRWTDSLTPWRVLSLSTFLHRHELTL